MAPFDQESFQKEIEKVRLARIKAHLRCKKLRARKRRLERKKYRIESFSKGAKKHQNPKPTPDRKPAQEKSPRIPRQKATVKQLAESSRRLPFTGLEVEEHILNKIKKCLQRASDPSTTEDEAKAALYISSKLMSQYDVTHADLIARASEDDDNAMRFAGRSIVEITSTQEGKEGEKKKVVLQKFVGVIASAVTTFFNCKSYSTQLRWSIEWTFYGIREHTIYAAMAFEMAHNKILDWAGQHRGNATVFSYCQGVADGLYGMATEERKKEQEAAHNAELARLAEREQEEMEQQEREIARLNKSVPDGSFQVLIDNSEKSIIKCDSDSEGYTSEPDFVEDEGGQGKCFNSEVDLEEEITRLLNRSSDSTGSQKRAINDQKDKVAPCHSKYTNDEPTTSPAEEAIHECMWQSQMQLILFRQNADRIADAFLKEQNNTFGNEEEELHDSQGPYCV